MKSKFITPLVIMLCVSLLFIYCFINKYGYPLHKVKTGVFLSPPVWIFETVDKITSSPAVDGYGQVYVRTYNSVIALDTHNGKQIWKVDSPGNAPLSIAPYVIGKYLIVAEKGSRIAVFTTDYGKLLWRTPIIYEGHYSPWIKSIVINNNIVYVARFDWTLTAYRIIDGQVIWEQKISGRAYPHLDSDEKVVYMGAGSLLKAYDNETGSIIWQNKLDAYIGQILLDDGTLYVIDESKPSVLAINPYSQELIWRMYYKQVEESEIGCLLATKNELYIAAKEMIAVSRIDGRIIWISNKIGRLECPQILGERLYVRNINNLLYSFDLLSGQELGRLSVDANTTMKHEPNRSPVVSGDMLIVPFSDYLIYAYKH